MPQNNGSSVVEYKAKFEWLITHYSAKTPKGKSGGGITHTLEKLAEDLSVIENMRRPWTKEYLFQIRRKPPKSVTTIAHKRLKTYPNTKHQNLAFPQNNGDLSEG